ncbi:MAG TPA: DUF1488 domain-containing protein [Candidatus Binatia bacterium]|nr:DUF1488 domain-containing protein [Candidatus Binatia bacterium]
MKDAEIKFAADEWYDHHRRKVVWFSAIVDDKCIDCGISIEALRDHFSAYYDDPLPAFRTHRARIQDAATKLIMQRRFEDDGKVLIRSADI